MLPNVLNRYNVALDEDIKMLLGNPQEIRPDVLRGIAKKLSGGKLSSEKETDESSSQALDLVKKTNKSVKQISDEVSNVVLGKEDTIEMVMAGILANGNILFEDFPGLAKTLMSNTLADALGCEFKGFNLLLICCLRILRVLTFMTLKRINLNFVRVQFFVIYF